MHSHHSVVFCCCCSMFSVHFLWIFSKVECRQFAYRFTLRLALAHRRVDFSPVFFCDSFSLRCLSWILARKRTRMHRSCIVTFNRVVFLMVFFLLVRWFSVVVASDFIYCLNDEIAIFAMCLWHECFFFWRLHSSVHKAVLFSIRFNRFNK